jgi:plastocyanin
MLSLPRIFVTAACSLGVLAGTAHGEVIVKGTGEPAFTNSANNTQWVEWSNNGPYKIEFNHYVNGGTAVVEGPYPMASTGSSWVNWSGIAGTSVPLTEGSTYTICGLGRWQDAYGMWFPDFSTSCGDADRRGLRASTTIDRTKPTVGVTLANGAAATTNPSLAMKLDFADNLAGPFPANFLCVQYGAGTGQICDSGQGYRYEEQPACSQPANGNRNTTFNCTVEVGGGTTPAPDGQVWVCAIAADASIPDNPNSADQRQPSSMANLSAPVCDSVLLDRAAPALAINAAKDTVTVGELVSFAAVASDATSGLTGEYAWTWGDNTANGAGDTATHTFTTPGTFEVSVKTKDAAGNEATAKKVVTVKPAEQPTPTPTTTPSPQPSPSPSPSPSPQPTTTPSPTSTPGTSGGGSDTGTGGTSNGGTSNGGTGTVTPPVATVTPAPTAVPAVVATIKVSAPGKLKLAKKQRTVPVSLAADAPGTVAVALVRGGKIIAQGGLALPSAGTWSYKLKLPKKAKAGAHDLTVTYVPDGGKATTTGVKVKLLGKAVKAAKASTSTAVSSAALAPTLPDGAFHGPKGRVAVL